ncbi:putative cytosolic iron-sulfur protein assembly protein Ciao1 [Anaeromyces robustus]|uniref:Probable cytosolic iron-sulfur protein assembly protein 1 n=1 Tax=Anaeromyces robustus TaxID=1754192 RepID=A0A1Y1WZP2_9FUNG|nr:putative cytosolic iron-sulfur protein assembly protein Ciao1 [Anaeromyces robustus]|eukprot:ORX79067.1 putative cytosolic iron-sulfur protein assembly protein Ciao1 [Anaeromyces robustus]
MEKIELVTVLKGHNDKVWQAKWNSNGSLICSCGADKKICVYSKDNNGQWKYDTLDEEVHSRTVRSVAFSPDNNFIASSSFDSTTAIWMKNDENAYEYIASLEGHENEVKSVAWSASGSLVATCSRDKSVWIWEVEGDDDFECLSVLQEHTQDVKMVAWHPFDEILVSASYDDTIRVWKDNEDDWYCADTLEGHISTVWAVDFNATGDLLASVSDDMTIRIWKCFKVEGTTESKWKSVAVLKGYHTRPIYSVSWSKLNNKLATCGGDNYIRIFELDEENSKEDQLSFKLIASKQNGHSESDINSVMWSTDKENPDLLLTAGDDNNVKLWKVNF